ncbi:hypothetical protein C6P40_004699, partial [Pichia californica]
MSYSYPKLGMTLNMLRDRGYRNLPDECKFDIDVLLDETVEICYHGPILSGYNYQEITNSLGVILKNHKFASFVPQKEFEYSSYCNFIQEEYGNGSESPTCYSSKISNNEFYLFDTPVNGDMPIWDGMSATEVWSSFHEVKYAYDELFVWRCFHVAKCIESGEGTCLSFGQFAQ